MAGAVIVDIFSGLGNQLFQFAAGYGHARRTGSELLVAPNRNGFRAFALDKFAIDAGIAPAERLRWRILKRVARLGIPPRSFREKGHNFDARLLEQKPPVRLHGYFQTELYFVEVAGDIRRMLALRHGFSPEATRIAELIAAAPLAVSIHVRRGDFLNRGPNSTFYALDADYYRRAAALLAARLGSEPRYFIFTDDPDWTAEALSFLPDRVMATVGLDRPEEDMILMSRCRHHIIANSTFSWWGAWLNPDPGKIVIGPRQWFTPLGHRRLNTSDLIPPGWILI